jgi:electron transfer flavoprotein beta subunit
VSWIISPYDEFAVEEALKVKEEHGGSVTILTVGPKKAQEAIRTALAMGADRGVLIDDPDALSTDGLGTAKILAAALKELPYDLIIAGQRAVDDEGYQVATAVAELADIPCVNLVIEQKVSDGKIACTRTVEGGTVTLQAPLPMLFTTQRGLNEPRYASLPGVMKAKKKPLDFKTLADIHFNVESLKGPSVAITQLSPPPARAAGRIIEGETAQQKAAELVKALREEAKVI